MHPRAAANGIRLVYDDVNIMANCFTAGRDLVRWELVALGCDGPYCLAMHHAEGSIVEYFEDVAKALARERQLEDLLIAAGASAPHLAYH